MASGAIGFSRYLKFVVPGIPDGWEAPVASVLCLAVTLLLCRRIGAIGKFSVVLWIGVLATLGIVIGLGLPHLKWEAFRFWAAPVETAPGLPAPSGAFGGLGAALILAVYDYLGYYNICYLAEEVKEPTKTIPRVIVVSILSVAVLDVLMNVSILSVLPAKKAMASKATVSEFVAAVAGAADGPGRHGPDPRDGLRVGLLSDARLLADPLGGGARRGFRPFARLHPTEGYPVVALFALGGAAALFSFIDLRKVVMAILSIRAVIPFMAQIVAALVLRRRLPDSARPFRMWLYPLPALVALLLWGFVLFSPEKGLRATGLVVIGAGSIAFLVRSRLRELAVRSGGPALRC